MDLKVLIFVAFLVTFSHAAEEGKEAAAVPPALELDPTVTGDLTDSRVAAGIEAKVTDNLDFARLTIVFQNQMQQCGGSLIHPLFVLTSATCVKE